MRSGIVVFLAAIACVSVSADLEATFPEIARSRSPSRIVSGWEAELGQIPFQVSLRMVNDVGGVNACGASIIHPEWAITAAHCTAGRTSFVLRAGTVNLTEPEAIFETTEFYNHPDYDNSRPSVVQPHDIGLLRLGRKITFSDRIQPVRLQSSKDMNKNYAGVRLVASGWGRTWTGGNAPENLQWVYLTGTSNTVCWLSYGGSSIIVDSTICASHYNVTSQSTCQGDSGGPLTVVDEDGELTLVGVTSFVSGTGCHTEVPAGFIRPGHYHDWIREVTGINFDWGFDETTTEAAETTTEAVKTTTEVAETTTEAAETTTEAAKTTTEAAETTTEAAETTTEAAETTTEAAKTTTETAKTTTEAADTTTEAAETTTEDAKTTTEAAETTTEAAKTTTEAPEAEVTEEAKTEATTEAAEEEDKEEETRKVADNFLRRYFGRFWA